MAKSEFLQRVISVIANSFDTNPAILAADSMAADVDGWDSVSHAMLVMNLEDEFDVELDIEATMAAANLGSLTDMIEAALAK